MYIKLKHYTQLNETSKLFDNVYTSRTNALISLVSQCVWLCCHIRQDCNFHCLLGCDAVQISTSISLIPIWQTTRLHISEDSDIHSPSISPKHNSVRSVISRTEVESIFHYLWPTL
jgi:hypothetical protein